MKRFVCMIAMLFIALHLSAQNVVSIVGTWKTKIPYNSYTYYF